MIGFVVVTHGRLGAELISTAEFILGRIDHSASVSVGGQATPEDMRAQIAAAIKSVDAGRGVIILTDMFGGTPSNLSLSFLADNRVEVLTGVNLPMLIKLTQHREKLTLADLAKTVGEYGRSSINVAGQILSQRNSH
ncbi:MAG: PTS sugar transporter subunit IIA [Proteobacteria bacterium]|nr:PTS sugar transporter subunit IIA [Pseudomonadota bacterium]